MKARIFAGAVLAAGLAAAAGSGRPITPTAGGQIRIVLDDMRFTPNRVEVPAGRTVSLLVSNRGTLQHDLRFPSLHMPGLAGAQTILDPGETRSLTVRFDAPGTHVFTCSLPAHAAAGMTGVAVVSP